MDNIRVDDKQIAQAQNAIEECVAGFYNNLPVWLRASLKNIPFVGNNIDYLLSQRGQSIYKKRIEHMLQCLSEELEKIKQDNIDDQYLHSEEFFDLMIFSFERTVKIRDELRIAAVAKVIKGALVRELDTIAQPENIISILAELNDDEAYLMGAIYLSDREENAIKSYGATLKEYLPLRLHERVHFLIKRIESLGLIYEQTGAYLSYGGGTFYLTPTGKAIIGYLKNDIVPIEEASEN